MWKLILLQVFCLCLSNADIYCPFETKISGVLECKRLGLRFNSLTSSDVLSGIIWTDIDTLKMRSLSILEVSGSAFTSAKPIKKLDLSVNGISFLDADCFQHLTNLQFLNISQNNLGTENVDLEAFFGLNELRELDLSENFLSVDADLAKRLKPLKKLRFLDISDNSNFDVTSMSFGPSIQHLIASNLLQTTLQRKSLDKAINLRNLVLKNSNIKNIPDSLLDRCVLLVRVDLSSNLITAIPGKLFSRNTRMEEIDISSNRLMTLNDDSTFASNGNLKILDFSRNNVTEISARLFSQNTKLVVLNMGINKLTALPANVFDALVNLQLLDLCDNALTELPELIFSNLTDLDSLSLSGNALKSLSENLFESNIHLRQLHLSDNKLEVLSSETFTSLTHLTILNLSRNRLVTLPPLLVSMKNLMSLYFPCNMMTYLPDEFFSVGAEIGKTVVLGGNPWSCSCLSKMLDVADANKLTYTDNSFSNGKTVTCIATKNGTSCDSPLTIKEYADWEAIVKFYPEICKPI